MVMTVKMQFTVSTEIDAPLSITLKHLSCVKDILQQTRAMGLDASSDQSSMPRLHFFRSKLEDTFENISSATWLSIRRQLLSFFEDRQVKVRIKLKISCHALCIMKLTGLMLRPRYEPLDISYEYA
jgi:hypothetical protein